MNRIRLAVYKLLLRLHPAEFRIRFAEEMILDYQEDLRDTSDSALYWDAMLSLGRQWMDSISPASGSRARTDNSLLGGQYAVVCQGGLTLFDLISLAVIIVAKLDFHSQRLPLERAA
ncbi:hypothetical protein [Edaphobacter aggregans]|uniref:hypothetical protein n=1 Tax=Edaphobacter aggregans TaxID=570835 RepID=UPI000555D93E|nr:hypothetical protein [Edaphobacter aggregans]